MASPRTAGPQQWRLATAALVDQLDRLAKVRALEAYLGEFEAERGPPTAEELDEAKRWADRVLTRPPTATRRRHRAGRSSSTARRRAGRRYLGHRRGR